MKNEKHAFPIFNIILLLFVKYNVTSDTYMGCEELLKNLNLPLRTLDIIIHYLYIVFILLIHRLQIDFVIIIYGILFVLYIVLIVIFCCYVLLFSYYRARKEWEGSEARR